MPNVYAILLKLSPRFTAELSVPGVVAAVAEAAQAGRPPSVRELIALGQSEDFAKAFVARLGYLLRLRKAGVLREAGPFADLKEGMYLCNAANERAARRVLQQDPLYRAGFIEPDFSVRQWHVAIKSAPPGRRTTTSRSK